MENIATSLHDDRAAAQQFGTSNIAVAAFLIAGKHLHFNEICFEKPGIATLVFGDPADQGAALERDFLTGGALVPGAEFHRQLRVLRRLIDEKQSCINSTKHRGSQNGQPRRY